MIHIVAEPVTRRPFGRARRAADVQRCFPPSVFPLWKPPFRDPPFQKQESAKGGKPRGATARRLFRRGLDPLGPQPQRGRAPPPSGLPVPLRRLSPVAPGPRGAGRVGRSCAGGPAGRTAPALQGRRAVKPCFPSPPGASAVLRRESRLHRAPGSWLVAAVLVAVSGIPESATITALRELRTGMNRREPERLKRKISFDGKKGKSCAKRV